MRGGGGLITGCIFCLQVDGPIACGGGGLVSRRAYKRQFMVFVLSFERVHLNKWH